MDLFLWAIVRDVCEKHGRTLQELQSRAHHNHWWVPRAELAYALRFAGLQLGEVSEVLNRDKATVSTMSHKFKIYYKKPAFHQPDWRRRPRRKKR